MGNKLYRIKNLIINLITKYDLAKKANDLKNNALKACSKQIKNIKSNGVTKKQTIIICGVLVACFVIIIIPTGNKNNPNNLIYTLEKQILKGDVNNIDKIVNITEISDDMSSAIVQELDKSKLTNDLIVYIKNELESNISKDFYTIIKNKGDFKANIKENNAVLSKFLNYLFNDNGRIIKSEILDNDSNKSTLKITIYRADINKETVIKLRLKNNGNNWRIYKILNLPSLLNEIEQLEDLRIKKLNDKIEDNFNKYIILKDFQKSDINTKDNSFLIRLSLENISDESIASLKGKLILTTKNKMLGSININVSEGISSHNFYEKAWSIKLNDFETLKSLASISSKQVEATFKPHEIIFEKGTSLKLIN